jgi:hypothetical protein
MRIGLQIYDVGNVPDAFCQTAEIGLAGLNAISGIIGKPGNRWLLRRRSSRTTPSSAACCRCRSRASTAPSLRRRSLLGCLPLLKPLRGRRATRRVRCRAATLRQGGQRQNRQPGRHARQDKNRLQCFVQVQTSHNVHIHYNELTQDASRQFPCPPGYQRGHGNATVIYFQTEKRGEIAPLNVTQGCR